MILIFQIIGVIKDIAAAAKKVKNGVSIAVNYKKILKKAILKYAIKAFIVILLIGTIVYSITYAVKNAWDYLTNKYNTTDINQLYDDLGNMSEEDKLAFQQTLAFMDPTKIRKYIDKQRQSVPASIPGTKTTDENGNVTTEQVTVDVSKLTAQYILPWQVVGAMDVITFNALDYNNDTVINASSLAMSQFTWAKDTTRDDTHFWKDWTVETESDDNGTRVIHDGEDSAPENYKTVKTPLGLAESVNTMFGLYTYDIKRDVVVLDEPYSARQLLRTETHSEESRHTNSDGSHSSETVTYTTYYYTKTRNKLVEDQATGPTFTFNPNKFIQFLNACKYSVKDLPLLELTLKSLPSTNNILDMIDRIVNGDYGDLNMGSGAGAGGSVSIGGGGLIPLFHQWDERWGSIPYGDHGTIATSACGPTSAAMVLTGLQGNLTGLDTNGDGILDPAEAAAYAVSNGYRVEDGTGWGYFADIGGKAGLNVREYNTSDYQQVYEELKEGHPVIASMGPGHFTSAGHFIVLAGLNADGTIKVNDPNRQECSDTPWDFNSIIVPEALQFWAFDNPNRKGTAFEGTGYTGAPDEGGGTGADGTNLIGKDLRDKLIAVDPTVIPLGSQVYIEVPADKRYQTMPDGTSVDMDGYYRACDTGSAIKGNHIDIYFGTGQGYKELCTDSWGTQTINVYLN
ncbi:3D domain-containing protein [uncultured Clostridium sp.]|uniref:3D domain-containing protein n=1 Tax=uncultured Clostridium sp. TaxID=59620 RepID=UPI0028E46A48|nr:3D domain-containing protein [uncultured Clostridium sp.]